MQINSFLSRNEVSMGLTQSTQLFIKRPASLSKQERNIPDVWFNAGPKMDLSINQISEYLKPIKEWSDSNEHAVNRLMQLQQYYFKDILGASFDQFRSLSQCSDPEQALKMNFYFCKGLEAHANYLSNQTMETLSEVHSVSLRTWDEASGCWASSMDQMMEKNLRPFNSIPKPAKPLPDVQ